jgi:acetylornithine deacetylase/succinyl-diaminopimelate desuccinylase-like protein
MLDQALELARAAREPDLADLLEELRIPSVSTLPEHRADCRANADWLLARFRKLGFEAELIDVLPDGNPVLRADWSGRPRAPHLTIYGHYDVQPPDPLDEWLTPPFEPTLRDGMLYARGVADNKGNHLCALKASEHWVGAGGPPVNLRFLIEGEEEIGGESLPIYVRDHASELASDCVILWDSGFTADDRPTICTGLRGLLYVEMGVWGPAHDLHSGLFGGVAPNPANELARIIAALKDDRGRVTIPGFYDDVREPDAAERERWYRPSGRGEHMRSMVGTDVLVGEEGFDNIERVWIRPTLDVNGMHGGFTGHGAKTIIPARASAKVSMRLVPEQRPDEILTALQTRVSELAAGRGVRVEVDVHSSTPAVLVGYDHAGARATARALEETFGTPAVYIRMGGSIPVSVAFQATGSPMVVSGVSHQNAAIHSPNEHLSPDAYLGGIETMIRLFQHFADA